MAKEKKELTYKIVLNDHYEGKPRKRNWEDIPEDEQHRVWEIMMDRAMASIGYTRVQEG